MRQVWQAIDGQVFTDSFDAQKHENEILQGITMWDWDGEQVNECATAMIVRLVGEEAASNFKKCNAADEDSVPVSDKEISNGDEGIWFWDEYSERYIPIELKTIKALSKVLSEID